mgnify:CR=1 FL=1
MPTTYANMKNVVIIQQWPRPKTKRISVEEHIEPQNCTLKFGGNSFPSASFPATLLLLRGGNFGFLVRGFLRLILATPNVAIRGFFVDIACDSSRLAPINPKLANTFLLRAMFSNLFISYSDSPLLVAFRLRVSSSFT